MTVAIRDANLKDDREQLIRFLCENLTKESDEARFDWLYLANPYGEAKAWIAFDEKSGQIAGVAAAFPRGMWIDGEAHAGWVLGDFCISPEQRSLGPALRLQRACLEAVTQSGNAVYDFPSSRMAAVYTRLGVRTGTQIVRHARMLRVDSKVESLVSGRTLQRAIAAVGNSVLRVNHRLRAVTSDMEVSFLTGAFGEEFSVLNSRTAGLCRFQVRRTAEYLNWRYLRNPLRKYRVVSARRDSELLGYAVVEEDGVECMVNDLQASGDANVTRALMGAIDALAYELELERIDFPLTEGSRLEPLLRDCGFYPREGSTVIVCMPAVFSGLVENTQSWCLMHGDRES